MADRQTDTSVYSLPLDITPAVSIPSVFLKDARQSVVPETGRRTGPYGVQLKTFGFREKILAVVTVILVVVLISLVSTFVFMYCRYRIHHDQSLMEQLAYSSRPDLEYQTLYRHSTGRDNSTNIVVQNIYTANSDHDNQRQPCVGKCWAYSAFRFRSQCMRGYCECHGPFYNTRTCLPDVYGCQIVRNKTEASAFFGQEPQTVYTCSNSKTKPSIGIHVISTYGHHNSPSTTVDFTTSSEDNRPITLILANYYPTKWRLNLVPSVNINEIVIVSNNHVEDSFVEVKESIEVSRDPLRIRRVSTLVGYGDDQSGAHTVGLLKYLIRHFGSITSFSGAHYADRWRVSLQHPDLNRGLGYSDVIR